MKITNVMAVSLDGMTGFKTFETDSFRIAHGFGCSADQEHVRSLIKSADAVITGANSVRASSGIWEQTNHLGKYPTWVVLSNRGLAGELRFWQQDHIPRVIASCEPLSQIPDPKCENFVYGARDPAAAVVALLAGKGLENVLLFGGGQINQLFYAANLVDHLKITITPTIVGKKEAPRFVDPGLPESVKLELVASHCNENHVFLDYRIRKKTNS